MCAQIGFLAESRSPDVLDWILDGDQVFRFDSGVYLSRSDMVHHMLVLGATGSGKTQSVAVPLVFRFMQLGQAGLVVDLKGNFREKVRILAEAAGCSARLVEYGTGRFARPINILKGMTLSDVRAFFERIVMDSFHGQSNNVDFHMRGVQLSVDCFRLLDFLHDAAWEIEASVASVVELIQNEGRAQYLYQFFRRNIFDGNNDEHLSFVEDVEGEVFHLFIKPDKDSDIKDARAEQIGYILSNLRPALQGFLDVPGICEKFCAYGCEKLDIEAELAQGKVILLRFDTDTGPVGDYLARYVVSKFYEAVYKVGLDLPHGSFVLLDEFQEIADLGDSRFSDRRFTSMAREFGCSCVYLTQSLSALGSEWGSDGVEALVSNCNARVVFYSDDPRTQAMAARYGDFDLTLLKPQQALVVRYDCASRHHSSHLDTMNGAFGYGQAILAESSMREPEKAVMKVGKTLREIVKLMKKDEDKAGKPVSVAQESEVMREACRLFPQFFAENVSFALPIGWKNRFLAALKAVELAGLPLKIEGLKISSSVEFTVLDGYEAGRAFLDDLVRDISEYCPVCGAHSGKHRGRAMALCKSCSEKLGLSAESEKKEKADDNNADYDFGLLERI